MCLVFKFELRQVGKFCMMQTEADLLPLPVFTLNYIIVFRNLSFTVSLLRKL